MGFISIMSVSFWYFVFHASWFDLCHICDKYNFIIFSWSHVCSVGSLDGLGALVPPSRLHTSTGLLWNQPIQHHTSKVVIIASAVPRRDKIGSIIYRAFRWNLYLVWEESYACFISVCSWLNTSNYIVRCLFTNMRSMNFFLVWYLSLECNNFGKRISIWYEVLINEEQYGGISIGAKEITHPELIYTYFYNLFLIIAKEAKLIPFTAAGKSELPF